ncbi:17822_t:CDS:2 [Entrophospora sp. SA101]|nr:17822_t:CDS:2 [Entrophospora sp. SA101]
MKKPIIRVDPDEELDLVCRLLYYQTTGYHSNSRLLYRDLKKEGYRFSYKKVHNWLINQNEWQKHAPSPKYIPRVSYGKITYPNYVHQCDLLRLTNDIDRKIYKWVLTIVDITSRFKYAIPLTSKNSSEVAKAFKKIYNNPDNPLIWPWLLQCDGGCEFMGETSRLMQEHNVIIRVIGLYSHRRLAVVERFNKTLAKMLYKVQYAVETISSNPKLIREWVKYLPEVINYLNNYPTRLIKAPGSKKWGLAPIKAIKLEKVESRPSTKYKRLVGRDEKKLEKGDTVRYLLANGEWEGVTENEPVLYYLEGNEFSPKRGFVKEELFQVDLEKLQYPPQSILSEKNHPRLVHFILVLNNDLDQACTYAKKHGGSCLEKTGRINDEEVFLWSCTYDELVNIARRYTKNWRNAVDILDKNLQGREFIVIDLTRSKEDPLYIRKGWDHVLKFNE